MIEPTVPRVIARMAAALLIVGALIGVILFGLTILRAENWNSTLYLLAFGFIILFASSGVVGVFLWLCWPTANYWALIAFFLQIPVLEISGFEYQYFTGLAANLLHGPGGTNLTFSAGAMGNLVVGGDPNRFVLGVNLVALAAVLALALLAHSDKSLERTRAK